MKLEDCKVDGSKKFKLSDHPTSAKVPKAERPAYEAETAQNNKRMSDLQERLYADGREGVVILLQAMDAAGKDSTIAHVMSGVNPQGVGVTSFKVPSKVEAGHDYFWRANVALPQRGYIEIFNRSYYEDVLVVRVDGLWHGYDMPKRCLDMDEQEFFDMRFEQIRNYEKALYQNGYRLIKIMLNVSRKEQKERFLARIDEPAKNWKFSAGDLGPRSKWPQYMAAFEDAIGKTSTPESPWYVIPADQKWYARALVSELVVKVLDEINPQFPEISDEDRAVMMKCREQLMAE